ncbi:MAG: UDP-2,3-diacylglucosamine diphosphatase [Candidatus Delongbacteria bacterium]
MRRIKKIYKGGNIPLKNKIYFLSDLHLKLDREPETLMRKQKFIRFLKKIPDDTCRIIFLGDIFDFWYEWYFVVPGFHFDVFYEIRKLIDRGVKIIYIAGNHDFCLGNYLKKEVGINCFSNEMSFEHSKKRFWIYHGDGIAASDKSYRLMKKILRSGISNFLFRTFIPPDLGILIAKMTSGTSRKYRSPNKKKHNGSEYLAFAGSKIKEGYDFVLMGHRHYPETVRLGKGMYVNTGDWMKHFSYAVFDGENIKIEKYNG